MHAATGARPKRAEVMQRQTKVVELASAGLDYDQIAEQLGACACSRTPCCSGGAVKVVVVISVASLPPIPVSRA